MEMIKYRGMTYKLAGKKGLLDELSFSRTHRVYENNSLGIEVSLINSGIKSDFTDIDNFDGIGSISILYEPDNKKLGQEILARLKKAYPKAKINLGRMNH